MISAKFVADFSDFQSAVAKAETSLRGFEGGAGKVETSLNRMANSLSGTKLIQDATLMSEAVDRVGGVSKLTEKELARVSAQAQEAADKLVKMGMDVPPGIQKIADAGAKTGGVFSDLTNQVKATALGFVSAQAIIGIVQGSFRTLSAFVSDSIQSYASAEAAAKKMTTALQAQGTATPDVIAHFNDLATSFQRTTVYSDDLINEMQALLTQVGDVAPGQMDKALQAATDLASGLGIDLRAATILVSKASEENVGALKKAGVQLDETRIAGEGMTYILGEIEKRFGGQAQSEIDTYAGKVKQLANEWDNFKESVGKTIVENPFVVAALRNMTKEAQEFNDQPEKSKERWTAWLGLLGAGFDRIYERQKHINEDAAILAKIQKDALGGSALPQGAAFSFTDLMAGAKKFGDELVNTWKKGDAAAKKYSDAVEAGFRRWSGAGANEAMGILDANFRQIAKSGKITTDQIDAMVKEAIKLQSEGAKLTPQLWEMARATDALAPHLGVVEMNLGKVGQQLKVATPELFDFQLTVIDGIGAWTKFGSNVGKPEIPDAIKKAKDSVGELSRALAELAQVSGGSLGSVVQGMSTIVSAVNSAQKGVKSLQDGMAGFKAGDFLSGLAGMSTGILGIASAAIAAGKAIAGLFKHEGRDMVVDFAESMGGFDALHAELNALGEEGERLWKALTQGVGKNNPKEAQAAIDAITKALAKKKAESEESTVATEAEAQATIETAAEAAKALDELGVRLKTNRDEWGEWSDDVTGYLQRLADDIRSMPLPTPGGPSGTTDGGGSGTSRYTGPASGPSGRAVNITVISQLDGREVARNQVKHLPAVLTLAGR